MTTPRIHLLVMAKTPVPGQVKTRLCPPATPRSAALIAAAALTDTLDTIAATPASHRTLVLANPQSSTVDIEAAPLWTPAQRPPSTALIPQRGTGLANRLANAHADATTQGSAAQGSTRATSTEPAHSSRSATPTLLIGMDTPQVTTALLTEAATALEQADAVLGMAADGGWWALGLNDATHAEALRTVPMSTPDTGRLTLAALEQRGLRVTLLPVLRDVDTAADAHAVAATCPPGRFPQAVATLLPSASRRADLVTAGSEALS